MQKPLMAAALILGCFTLPAPGRAQQAVACVNCSTVWQQIQDAATQVKQLSTQASQLQTELNTYSQTVQQGLALPMQIWTTVQSDIAQVRNLTNAASLLTGNSGSILNRLQSAQGYLDQAMYLPGQVSNQVTMWQQTLANANSALGRVSAVQQQQELTYAATQAAANLHSQTAAGQMQAIQASNEQLSIIATQLNTTQATLLAASQQAATRDEIAADRQAMQDAQWRQFISATPLQTSGWPKY